MEKNINVFIHFPQEDKILQQLSLIIKNLKHMATKQEQMDAALLELKDDIAAIATRIQAFIDAGTAGVSDASLAELQADADALKDIGTPPAA